MGQWGLETSAGDSVHDLLQEIKVDVDSFTQKDVKPLLDYSWGEKWATNRDKLGVVTHLLTLALKVPIDKLEEVLQYAKDELKPSVLRDWSEGRKEMVELEIADIEYALAHKGKGRKRHVGGLFENMAKAMGKEETEYPKTIELPCFGIKVVLGDEGSGSVTSDLKETCPYCEDPACDMGCPEFGEHCTDRDPDEFRRKEAERYEFLCHRAAVDAVESMILGHAIAGIDISSPAYIEGIETCHNALTNADFSVEV